MSEVSLSGPSLLAQQERAPVRSLSSAELLDVWERGQDQAPVERALTMLSAAYPDAPRDKLAAFSIGERDSCLLTLRQNIFGEQLSSLADCPACNQRLEMSFNVSDIRAPSGVEPARTLSLEQAGYRVEFRLPNSLDLLAVAVCASPEEMRGRLFEQCVLNVEHCGRAAPIAAASEIPAEVIDTAIERIAQADPQADVQVDMTCPCCGHEWGAAFDIVSYLWTELHARAVSLLREVHLLASAYGWRESDILVMSSRRRRCYLEMLL